MGLSRVFCFGLWACLGYCAFGLTQSSWGCTVLQCRLHVQGSLPRDDGCQYATRQARALLASTTWAPVVTVIGDTCLFCTLCCKLPATIGGSVNVSKVNFWSCEVEYAPRSANWILINVDVTFRLDLCSGPQQQPVVEIQLG